MEIFEENINSEKPSAETFIGNHKKQVLMKIGC